MSFSIVSESWREAERRRGSGLLRGPQMDEEPANVDGEAELPAAEGEESLQAHRLLGLGGASLISLRAATPG